MKTAERGLNMKLIYQYDENSPKIKVTLSSDASLSDVLETFQSFLVASGYVIDGTIDIVPNESAVPEEING